MNQINPKKLLGSKWTAVQPKNKQKHFVVDKVEFDEDDLKVVSCSIEAIINRQSFDIDWRELKDSSLWIIGWK